MISTFKKWTVLCALGATLANVCAAQSSDLVEALKSCARTADRDTRIGCYERLGERALREERTAAERPVEIAPEPEPAIESVVPAEPAATATAATGAIAGTAAANPVTAEATAETAQAVAQPLPDDIGGADFEAPEDRAPEAFVGRLSSCTRGHDSRWVFRFENGQIWKQADYRRARFRDCDAQATITKDRFGYRLRMEGSDRSVRVSRRQ